MTYWDILVVWLECRFLDTEVDSSNPCISMLCPRARHFISIGSVASALKWVPGGNNLVKVVQCYELFGGIALKNNDFLNKYAFLQTMLRWWQWWGILDIIWNRVTDWRRNKREQVNIKCCLNVCRSVEKMHGVWAGASVARAWWIFCGISVLYDGLVLLFQW